MARKPGEPVKRKKTSTRRSEVIARREAFIAAFAQTGNATTAAIAAGFSENGATVQGERLLRDADLARRARDGREAFLQQTREDFEQQQALLRAESFKAIQALAQVAAGKMPEEGNSRVGAQARVLAAVAILDRAGHKPIERIQQQVAWADVGREMADVDVESVLVDALRAIRHDTGEPTPKPEG
ncbi:MAG TPA: terminase small subunit [Rhodanobacteraceae bacterium]|nr:terminase small subunit [Rhodanobacteraceae bacterium]